jgi:hypothetical protein
MQLKDDVELPSLEDFYYDLMAGGYIKPEALLDNAQDAQRVRDAMKTIQEFEDLLQEAADDLEDDED